MHRGIFQADVVVLAQQIVAGHRRDVIVAHLIGIFGRRREIGGEGNLVAAKHRRVDDVELFLGGKGDELLLADEFPRRAHRFVVDR